jgi:hypothetical protein
MYTHFSLYVNGDLTELNNKLADGWAIDRYNTQATPHGILYVLSKYTVDPITQDREMSLREYNSAPLSGTVQMDTPPVEYNFTTRR